MSVIKQIERWFHSVGGSVTRIGMNDASSPTDHPPHPHGAGNTGPGDRR
jgi:hypothetical protein